MNKQLTTAIIPTKTLLDLDSISLGTRFFSLITLLYAIEISHQYSWFAFPLLVIMIYGIIIEQSILKNSIFWLCAGCLLSIGIVINWYVPANHHFILTFICYAYSITFSKPKKDWKPFFNTNAWLIVIILMFFASFQKLFSPSFVDGSFIGYIFLKGGFFQPILSFFPEYQNWITNNKELMLELSKTNPNSYSKVAFSGSQELIHWISKCFACLIFLGEFLVFYVFLFIKNQKSRHIALVLLIIGVFSVRLECGFLSILCGLGLVQCPIHLKSFRLIYILLILTFSALIILKFAYP